MTSLRVLFAVTLTLVICECATVRSLRATNSGGVRLSRSQGSWRIQARPHSFDDVYEEERDHSLALAPSSGLDGSGSVGEVLKGAPGSLERDAPEPLGPNTLLPRKLAKVVGYSVIMAVMVRVILNNKRGAPLMEIFNWISVGSASIGPKRSLLLGLSTAATAIRVCFIICQSIAGSVARRFSIVRKRLKGGKNVILLQMHKEQSRFLSSTQSKAKREEEEEVYEHISYVIRAAGMGSDSCLHRVEGVLEKIPEATLVSHTINMSKGLLSLTLRMRVQTQIDVLEALILPSTEEEQGVVDSDDIRIVKNLCSELSSIGYPSNAVQRIERGIVP